MPIVLHKVLISDEVDPQCVQILKANGIEVTMNTKLSKTELIDQISNYDGLIVRSATKVTADVINAGTNLKIIGRAGTGVDNIDCQTATDRGIIVMNTPGGNTLSAAEHTCALIISLTRDLALAAQTMREGRWSRKEFMGIELYGKTLAIIGLGRIGREVAIRMQSFGMRTIGFDPIIGADVAAEFNTEWLPLEQLWPQADFITLHTPLIPATTNLINDEVFSKCKRGVRVVNCARGGIIDEAALLRALDSGHCGGAGLDVFLEEPPTDFTLAKHPKVTATPHLGASTHEAQSRVAIEIAQQFVDLVQGKQLFGAINAPALTNALSPATQPWVQLGENLGVIGSLLTQESFTSIHLVVTGTELEKAGSFLSAAVLAGYLRSQHGGGDANSTLNLVNAPVLARKAGITISTNSQAGCDANVNITFSTQSGQTVQLQGTVTAGVAMLCTVQNCLFVVPAMLKGPIVIFKAEPSEFLLTEIIGAVGKSGASVVGFSVSESSNSAIFGIINLSIALTNGVEALKKVALLANQIVF